MARSLNKFRKPQIRKNPETLFEFEIKYNETFLSDFQTTVLYKMKSKIMTMSAMVFAVITHQWTLGTARKCMQIRCKNSSILMEKNGKNFLPVESTKIRAWHAKSRRFRSWELSEKLEKLLRSIEIHQCLSVRRGGASN